MRQQCIDAVQMAAGRTLTKAELDGLQRKMIVAMRQAHDADPAGFAAMTPNQRYQAAAKLAADMLVEEKVRAKQRLVINAQVKERLDQYVASFADGSKINGVARTLVEMADAKSGTLSAETRIKAISKLAEGQLSDLFKDGHKTFGIFTNREAQEALIRELLGEDSGNAQAKKAAEAFRKVNDDMVKRLNEAGGTLHPLENYVPQKRDQLKVAKVGKDEFVNDHLSWVKREMYMNDDGTIMSDSQLRKFFEAVFETDSTGGTNKLVPGQGIQGKRSIGAHRDLPRQVHYKDADSYMAAMEKYGSKSFYSMLSNHIKMMATDIGLVETYGSNPEYAFKALLDDAKQKDVGAARTEKGNLDEQARQAERYFDFMAGHREVANAARAKKFQAVRNWIISTTMGSAGLNSLPDQATLHLTASLNGLSHMQVMANQIHTLSQNKEWLKNIHRLGLAVDEMQGTMNRWAVDELTHDVTSAAAHTVVKLSALNAINAANEAGFGVAHYDTIGHLTRKHASLADITGTDGDLLRSKGVDEKTWSVWRAAEVETMGGNNTLLTPDAIYAIPNDVLTAATGETNATVLNRLRTDAATKLAGTVISEAEMAAIKPGIVDRVRAGADLPAGEWGSEFMKMFFLLKMTPIAVLARHWKRAEMFEGTGKWAYRAAFMASSALLGAVAMQINEVVSGRDPRNLVPDSLNPLEDNSKAYKSYLQAVIKGGGFGVYGDLLFADTTQHGNTPIGLMGGPAASLLEDTIKLTKGNVDEYLKGRDTKFGGDLVQYAKSHVVPGNNIWWLKAGFDRMITSQLQDMLNPGYSQRAEQRASQDYGQNFWWHKNEPLPSQGPNLGSMLGR